MGDARVGRRRLGHHARDVADGVLSRREHVGKRDDLARSRVDAGGEPRRDTRFRQLHVSDAHDHIRPNELPHELTHAVEHGIGGGPDGAMIDEKKRLHGIANLTTTRMNAET